MRSFPRRLSTQFSRLGFARLLLLVGLLVPVAAQTTTVLGSTSPVQTATLTFPANTSLGSLRAVTQGVTGLDFNVVPGGTCGATQCTVNYTFTPTQVGQRLGAVELLDQNNNLVATAFVGGVGVGPMAAYSGGTVATYATAAATGVVLDPQGNVYVVHGGGVEVFPYNNLNSSQTFTVSGLNGPQGAAMDGAGNLYIANAAGKSVVRVPNINGVLQYSNTKVISGGSGTGNQHDLAIDAAGNVFVSTSGSPANIYKIAAGSDTETQIASVTGGSGNNTQGIVFGADGNLYLTVNDTGEIVEVVNPEAATASANAVVTTVANPGNHPLGLGVDGNGDLYYDLSDSGNIYRISNIGGTLQFGSPVQVGTVAKGRQIGMDAAGSLYVVSDNGNLTVINLTAPPAQSYPQTNVGQSTQTQSEALTNIGNASLSFGAITYDPNFPNESSSCGTANLAPGFNCDFTTSFIPTVAGSPVNGVLSISDNAVNETKAQTITQSGTALLRAQTITFFISSPVTYGIAPILLSATGGASGNPVTFAITSGSAIGALSGANNSTLTVSGAGTIEIEASQAGNNAYAAAQPVFATLVVNPAPQVITFTALSSPVTVNSTATLAATSNSGLPVTFAITAGVATISGSTVTYTNAGTVTISASAPANANYVATSVSQIVTVSPEPVSYTAPETAVGRSSTTQVAYVNLSSGGAVVSVAVVTQGATGLDFTLAGGTCQVGQTYTAGQACEVDYTFSPKSPGERQGGIVLKDASGNILGTSYLGGVGDGPLGLFSSPTASWTVTASGNFAVARGLSVDGSGNVYFASTGDPQGLDEIPAGGHTVVQLAATSVGTGGTAVDGAGNVYLASANQAKVFELIHGSLVTISSAFQPDDNLEVDGAGNLYTSDYQTGAIYERAAGAASFTTIIPGNQGRRFIGLAVDPAGDIFAPDFNNNILFEIKAGTNTLTTLASGGLLSRPHAVAVDPAGNLYVANYSGPSNILRYAAGTWQVTSLPATASRSLILDGQGNLYGGTDNTVAEYSRLTPPTLNFPATTYGQSGTAAKVAFENDGNALLNISGYAASTNFGANGAGNTCATGSMAVGAACSIVATFTPPAVGNNQTGSLTISDDSSNGGTQVLNLEGSGTPAGLTITASSGTMTYGGTPPAITASYSGFVNGDSPANLTTAPTCTTTATSASTIGSYATSCTGAVDANYTITYVAGSVRVNPPLLVITASSGRMTYGGAVPAITASYSGFVNGDSAASLTTAPACTTTATSGSTIGSYVTSCTGAVDPNYTISYAAGSVQVNPAPLVITASSGAMTYGGAVPVIAAGYSGFVNGDSALKLTTAPACSTLATSSSHAGSYDSSCTGAVDANYSISYVVGSVQVNPAPLVITASSGAMTYGGAVPAITAGYSGFVNGDSALKLTTAPNCTTTATSGSTIGNYTTSCTGAADADYSISYVTGSVQVNPAPLVITASSDTMTYGGGAPAITAGYTGFVNADSALKLTTAPNCTTTATSSSTIGSYATSCTGAVDVNYTISYVTGSVRVNPAPLVITASSGSMTYGGGVPAITAGYSGFVNNESGLTLTTAPTCTVAATSSSTVGSYVTSCSGATDANYSISYVGGSVQVNPAPLVITASGGSMTYGGAAPVITAGYSGFVNNDSASMLNAAPVCSTLATSSSNVGSYASSCLGAVDANYTISYVAGTVQVNPVPLVVTASGGTMTYGGTAPAIGAGYSGFVNGDSASNLTTAPVCSTQATSSSNVGSYASSCLGAADANYTISYVGGTVTVTPATAVIRITPYNLVYDGAAHAAAGTAAGVGGVKLNGDLNLTGTVHTDAAGYTDTWSFTDPNGNYAPAGGTVTDVINPAQPVITFATVGPQLYEGNPITIMLSAASNGAPPVTITATGPATVNGNTLTITGVGTVTLTASAPASQDWLVASASQNVNVTLGMGWGLYATSNTCGAIHLTGRSFVDSYDSAAGAYPARLDQIHGSVGTNGNLQLDGGANVFGALYDPNGNTTGDCDGGHHGDSDDGGTAAVTSLQANGRAKVRGGITTLPAALVFPNPTMPTGVPTTSQALYDDCRNFSGCTVVNDGDGRGHGRSEVALAPGTYGNVRVDGNVTVDVRAGTYNFNSLLVAGGSLKVTSGPVIINLAGGQLDRDDAVLDLTRGTIANSAGPVGLIILYGGRGALNIAGGSSAAAVIYAPYSAVTLSGNGGDQGDHDGDHDDANAGGFSGSIVAATISLNGNAAVHYDRELGNQGVPVAGAGSPPPPAPSDRDGRH